VEEAEEFERKEWRQQYYGVEEGMKEMEEQWKGVAAVM